MRLPWRLELDEAWSFVYVKEANKERAKNAPPQAGDALDVGRL